MNKSKEGDCMDLRKLSEKSITGSLLRIFLSVLIIVGSLFILSLIYRVIIGDFSQDRNNTRLVFDPSLMHSYDNSSHSVVKKPTLLESIKDTYMGWRYGAAYFNAKYSQHNRRDKAKYTEKILVVNPMTNWDNKLADFCKKTGFMGKINNQEINNSTTWKVRNFNNIEGSFKLTEPRDTVIFRRNADFLVKNVLAIFDGEIAKVNLSKREIYVEKYPLFTGKNVTGYQAYYEQLLEDKIPNLSQIPFNHGLYIIYNIEKKNYQISNQLITMPSVSQKDKFGRQAALKLAKKELYKRNKDIQIQYQVTPSVIDTLSADMWKEYIVRYPEMKSPYYYYVQSIWHINFPWALYSDEIDGCDITYDDGYLVDAYNGKVYGD